MDHVAQIKARLPIAELVGSYIKLERAGSNLRAICPFHKEKTASFNVSPSRDAYYCFGCAEGGDIFTFVQKIEGITFPEALKILADKAGVTLPEKGTQYLAEKKDSKDRLIDLMDKTTSIFEAHLKNNPDVIDYLKSRGLTEDSISKFRIGFAPLAWRELYEALKIKGFRDEEIERTKVTKKVEGKGYYDTFRGRIMFPISDSSGRVVAFTGRVFGDQKNPDGTPIAKYLNSPEGELYDKSSILFGYDKAKLSIRKQDSAIVVEGQMDCIMSHQAGADNTIAISGTAFTVNQINLIKRLTNKIVFALDVDNAGVQATIRSAKIALAEGMQVKVVMVPDGKDPADFIQTHAIEWVELLSKPEPIISYLLKLYIKLGLQGESLRERIQKEVFPLLNSIKSRIAQAQVISEIARVLSVKEEVVWDDVSKSFDEENSTPKYTTDVTKNEVTQMPRKVLVSPRIMVEEELLGLLVWQEVETDKLFDTEAIRSQYDKLFEEYGLERHQIEESDHIKYSIISESKYSPNLKFDDLALELLERIEKEILAETCASLSDKIRLSQNIGEDQSEHVRQLSLLIKKQKHLEDRIKNRFTL